MLLKHLIHVYFKFVFFFYLNSNWWVSFGTIWDHEIIQTQVGAYIYTYYVHDTYVMPLTNANAAILDGIGITLLISVTSLP